MTDIRIVQYSQFAGPVLLDWLLTPLGQLDETEQLATAIIVALGTDGLAAATDTLPNIGDDNLRGWWGDLDADTIWNGWPIGSKLWLLSRSKITGAGSKQGPTVAQVQHYINACIQPFIKARVATSFTAVVTNPDRDTIAASIVIHRGPKSDIALQWQNLWNDIGAG